MDGLIGWLGVIAAFIIAIVAHEFAHAGTALALGLPLNRFQIGIPVILKFRFKEVDFEFGLIPIRGLIDIEGRFEDLPILKRFLTVLAGPLASIILGVLVFVILFSPGILGIPMFPVLQNMANIFREECASTMRVLPLMIESQADLGSKALAFLFVLGTTSFLAGLMNLIPIPALDGSWLLFVIIEKLTRWKIILPTWFYRLMLKVITLLSLAWLIWDTFFRC